MLNDNIKSTLIQALQHNPHHLPSLLGLAKILLTEADLFSTEALLQAALELAPESAEVWALLGQLQDRCNQPDDAILSYQQALILTHGAQALWHVELGILLLKNKQPHLAQAHFYRALADDPHCIPARFHLGKIARQTGHFSEAETLLLGVVESEPEHVDAWFQLSLSYERDQQIEPALQALKKVLRLDPTHLPAALKCGQLLEQASQWREALICYQEILTHHPQAAEAGKALQRLLPLLYPQDIHNLYGDILAPLVQLFQQRMFKAALPHLERVRQWPLHNRHKALVLGFQGFCYQECGLIEEALASFAAGLKYYPHPLLQLAQGIFLPVIYPSLESVQNWRLRWLSSVEKLSAEQPVFDMLPLELPLEPFYLAYQGENDREPLRQLSQLYRRMLGPFQQTRWPSPTQREQPRIGVVSRHLNKHSVMDCFEPVLAALPQAGFELYLFSMPGSFEDHITERLKTYAHEFIPLTEDIQTHYQVILEQNLDILLFTDIGMDSLTYLLAHYRVAPIQCVLSGHPVTTGIDTIDYFISSARLEPPEAQQHYSEQLVLLPEIPVCYPRPALPAPLLSRAELDLPVTGNLYVCPMTNFKFHPLFDAVLAAILQRDPHGYIVFFDFQDQGIHLKHRWQKSLPLGHERLVFLPWMPKPKFLNILALADVVLDTFPFGAGNTAYLTLGVGTPLVTLPGQYLRGRSSYGLYQQMGMTECIASTPQHYVDLAIRIATEPEWAMAIRAKIAQQSPLIFDRQEGLQQLLDFFRQVIADQAE